MEGATVYLEGANVYLEGATVYLEGANVYLEGATVYLEGANVLDLLSGEDEVGRSADRKSSICNEADKSA